MRKIFVCFCLFFANCYCVFASDKMNVEFYKCIDGDTAKFIINGDIKTVRFLSINAPEVDHNGNNSEPFGNEARDYTCNLLSSASVIEIQYDPRSDKKDKYDRLLAWIFVDGELLQEKLVSKGLSEVKYVYDDYMYSNKLYDLENIAKEKGVGMWYNNNNHSYYLLGLSSILIVIFISILFILFKKKRL